MRVDVCAAPEALAIVMAADAECDAECDTCRLLSADRICWYPEMGYPAGKSYAGEVGEKLVRVVGFGAFKDVGGFVLGLSMGGESGRSVKAGGCFAGPEVIYGPLVA